MTLDSGKMINAGDGDVGQRKITVNIMEKYLEKEEVLKESFVRKLYLRELMMEVIGKRKFICSGLEIKY